MISDAAITELKLRCPCDKIAAQWVKLRKHGKKLVGPCPLHSPDPNARDSTSFECDAEGWVCAVCHDGGDVIRLVALRHGLDPRRDFAAAIDLLGGVVELTPERAAELETERAVRADKRQQDADTFREKERRAAFEIWHAGHAWRGTPVETYLRQVRGIGTLPDGLQLRYAPTLAFFHGEEINEVGRKAPRVIHRGPAMLAPFVDAAGTFRAVHITWLDLAQPNGKAVILDPDNGDRLDAKKMRGSKAGNVIRLAECSAHYKDVPVTAPGCVGYAGEGIETVLSVYHALAVSGRDLSGAWFRALGDLGNLAGRSAGSVRHPTLRDAANRARRVPGPAPDDAEGFALPPGTSDVVLLGDGDSDRFETACALRRASLRLQRRGVSARVAWAPAGQDFNDVLRTVGLRRGPQGSA